MERQAALMPRDFTTATHPNYWIYEKRLSEGWIFGRKVVSISMQSNGHTHLRLCSHSLLIFMQDNTDRQFRTFRNGLPSLLGLAGAYLTASYIYPFYLSRKTRSIPVESPTTPTLSRAYERIPFLLVSSLVILFILHGVSAFKILILLYLNYSVHAWSGNSKYTPYIIWIFNIAMLFSNEIFHGYQLGSLLPELAFLVSEHTERL